MNFYQYDKDYIKKTLTIEQVHELVAELGGEPQPIHNNFFISKTISHNARGEGSYKLYYYQNDEQGIFKDYTGGDDAFDIFELVRRVKSREEPLADNKEWEMPQAVAFVAQYFGFSATENNFKENFLIADWKKFDEYDKINNIQIENQIAELKTYDEAILKNLPRPLIEPWLRDHISKEIMDTYEICYDPVGCGIIIPHRDQDNRLVGIRARTLSKEDAALYGKYRPAYLCRKLYNHPLSFTLYGLNLAKDNIAKIGKVIVFEGEKSVLQYATYFGIENCIAVATCGSSLTSYQVKLLKEAGAKEIIIAFDKAGEKDDKTKYVKKFYDFRKKYGNLVDLSFIYDKDDKYLGFKDSPTDKGKEIFLNLFKERIII